MLASIHGPHSKQIALGVEDPAEMTHVVANLSLGAVQVSAAGRIMGALLELT